LAAGKRLAPVLVLALALADWQTGRLDGGAWSCRVVCLLGRPTGDPDGPTPPVVEASTAAANPCNAQKVEIGKHVTRNCERRARRVHAKWDAENAGAAGRGWRGWRGRS